MLPRWHIIWGIVFCVIFKLIAPSTSYVSLFIIWFASVFIDFDHYFTAAFKHGKWNPLDAVSHSYEKREEMLSLKKEEDICEKGDFHLFHTVESHFIIGLIALVFSPFFFVFVGMVLHSLLDLIWIVKNDVLDSREFFLINRFRMMIL